MRLSQQSWWFGGFLDAINWELSRRHYKIIYIKRINSIVNVAKKPSQPHSVHTVRLPQLPGKLTPTSEWSQALKTFWWQQSRENWGRFWVNCGGSGKEETSAGNFNILSNVVPWIQYYITFLMCGASSWIWLPEWGQLHVW